MKKRNAFQLIILVAVILLLPMAAFYQPAESGILNVPRSGQTVSQATGDDGDVQAGAVWPGPRFTCYNVSQVEVACTDASRVTIMDELTGLMWAYDSRGPASFNGAMPIINALNFGGYTDWRMPNIREMESLTNAGEANSATWLNGEGFTLNTGVDSRYWVSNAYANVAGEGWVINLTDGRMRIHNVQNFYFAWPWSQASFQPQGWPLISFYYLPVRDGANGANDPAYPANVPKTGLLTPYVPNDDGSLRRGVDWPVTCLWESNACVNDGRFINLGDGTILDVLTGLMWLEDQDCLQNNYADFDTDGTAGDGSVYWQTALDFVEGINNDLGTPGVDYFPDCGAGHTDWRFANRKELFSLVTMGLADPVPGNPETSTSIYLQDQGFNWANDGYWTSTVFPDDTSKAYSMRTNIRSPQIGASTRATTASNVPIVRTGPAGFTLTSVIVPAGTGTVADNPPAPPDGYLGEDVDLTPTAGVGYAFGSWAGCDTDDFISPCTMTMDNFKEVFANFIPPAVDTSVAFGTVTVGANPTRTVTVTNDGITDLVIDNIGAVNGVGLPFSLNLSTCGASPTLTPGSSCELIVGFSPTAAGVFADSFNLSGSVTVNVSGTGVSAPAGPDIGVSASALDFTNTPISTAPVQTVNVANDGSGTLTISAITGPALPFSIDYSGCPGGGTAPFDLVGTGTNCDIDVTYTAPGAPQGPDLSSIVITSNDPDESPLGIGLFGSTINGGNLPPVKPRLQLPANGAMGVTVLAFSWEPDEYNPSDPAWDPLLADPDGDAVTHTLYYGIDPSFTTGTTVIASAEDTVSSFSYAMVLGNPVFMIALFGIVAMGVFLRRKKIALIIVTMVIVSGLLLTACGNHKSEDPGSTTGGAGVSGALQAGTTYYWKVVADDGNGGVTPSDIWSFTTAP